MVGQLDAANAKIHAVGFYPDDGQRAAAVAAFVLDAIERDGAAVLIATAPHLADFAAELSRSGLDVDRAERAGDVVMLDAGETLSRFSDRGGLDADAFDDVIGGLIRRLRRRDAPVAAYGEMVAVLWDAGQVLAAFELEELWNALLGAEDFALFCSYPADVQTDAADEEIRRLHELHSHVVHGSFTPWRSRVRVRHDVRRAFPGELDSIADARRFVTDAVTRWGYGSRVDDLAVVVSELVTNAVLHAQTDVTVHVSSDGSVIRVAVEDGHRAPPAVVTAPSDRISGRGLFLVDTLADRWGTETAGANGKIVWAELSVASEPR
jgi:anti-sigma regulatory factor (Ser/Thr protein kinase)